MLVMLAFEDGWTGALLDDDDEELALKWLKSILIDGLVAGIAKLL